jgi:hypothetical protein
MNDSIRTPEMTVLLAAILAAQWFSSTADGFLDACGNAVFLALLVSGLVLTLLSFLLTRLSPKRGLLTVCQERKGFVLFPLISFVLFALLSATALRDTLTMLSEFLLPQTPRWFSLVMLLPVLVLTAWLGIASVSRAMKLVGPALLVLYLIVLTLSVWNQGDVYNFFPILGGGLPALGRTALNGLSVIAWLPMLWIDRPQLEGANKAGLRAPLYATILCVVGYIAYGLLFPNGGALESNFPLHRLSAAGGFSHSFQRTHALFVFVWLPVQLAAVSAGLCYAARSLRAVFPVRHPRALLPLPLALIAILGFRDMEHSPMWLNYLLQTNLQSLLILPLLIPMIVGKATEKRREKEARHA